MTILNYPACLPCFSKDDHSYHQQNTIARSKFLSGRTRPRRTHSVAPEFFTVSTVMTDHQLETFESWVHYELNDVDEFNVTIHTARGYQQYRVSLEKNDFKKSYQGSGRWKLSLLLVANTQQYLSREKLAARLAE